MKGFDDHLDNYGDPGDDSLYPECEHTPPCTGDREDAPCFNDDEPTVIVEGREYFTFHDDAICPECGASRPVGRIADHMASEHSDDDYTSESGTAEILADPDTLAAIAEGDETPWPDDDYTPDQSREETGQ